MHLAAGSAIPEVYQWESWGVTCPAPRRERSADSAWALSFVMVTCWRGAGRSCRYWARWPARRPGIAGPVRTRGAGTAVAATLAFGVVGAAAALGARGSKPFAYVVFPDGTLYQSELTDKRVAARAQADVLRFNVLAARGDIALRRKVRQGVSLARCR